MAEAGQNPASGLLGGVGWRLPLSLLGQPLGGQAGEAPGLSPLAQGSAEPGSWASRRRRLSPEPRLSDWVGAVEQGPPLVWSRQGWGPGEGGGWYQGRPLWQPAPHPVCGYIYPCNGLAACREHSVSERGSLSEGGEVICVKMPPHPLTRAPACCPGAACCLVGGCTAVGV